MDTDHKAKGDHYLENDFARYDMSVDLKAIDARYAHMVISIQLDGAIRVCDTLGIDSFVLVAPGKDLITATSKSINGWHYKVLSDGAVYIASMAMQQLVVARGIEKMLPWVQNHVNPRVKACVINKRIVGEINRSLLLRAGDVETNPGPVVRQLCCVITFAVLFTMPPLLTYMARAMYPLDFANFQNTCERLSGEVFAVALMVSGVVGAWFTRALTWLAGSRLDTWAHNCALEEYARLQWKQLYGVSIVGYTTSGLSRLFPGLVPSYGEVQRPSLWCETLGATWGLPVMVSPWGVFDVLYYSIWVTSACGLLGSVGCVMIVARVVLGGVRRVRVINKQKPFVVNDLKDEFKQFTRTYQPRHIAGTHSVLASQRRDCEEWCLGVLLDKFERVRDVGGSRSRFANLGFAKHVCGPVLSNDDILREEKSRGCFENCGVRGESCPKRLTIPAAVLSHVDYHMTVRQITQCVTGPTFIINHDFNRFERVGLYKDGVETKCEADVDIFGASVRMQPEGGTPYGAHPFHNWQSEGSVISCDGAFVYVRLGDFGETSVYYCHPSDGVYSVNDPNALTTKHYDTLPNVCGYEVTVDHGAGEYRFRHVANNVDKRVNKGVVDEIALTMASCLRDEKYPETLRSYLTGKIRAAETDRSLLELIYGLVSYLSDLHAVKTVPFATCVQGHPVNFGWYDIVKFRIKISIMYFVRVFGDRVRNRVAGSSFVRHCAPWMFTDIAVPSYEVYVKNAAAKFGTGLRGRFNREQFPATSSPGIAGGDGRGQHDSGENAGQRISLNGNSSAERCAETPATFVPPVKPNTCVRSDAHCKGAKSRTQSESSSVELRRSECASITSEGTEGGAHVELEGARGGWGDSVSTNIDTPIRREQGGFKVKPVQPPSLVVTCEEREGLVDSISVQTLLGTAHSWEPTRVDKTALRDANISAGDLCITIEEILREIAGRSVDPINYGAIIIWCVRFLINPNGRYSDKSSVPQGTGLLPIVPGSFVPEGFKTYATGGVVIALSPSTAGSIAGSDVTSGRDGVDEKGRDRKVFSKNRNKHQGRRSS